LIEVGAGAETVIDANGNSAARSCSVPKRSPTSPI
jgi:hypothetical protein